MARRGEIEALAAEIRKLQSNFDRLHDDLKSTRAEIVDVILRGFADLRTDNAALRQELNGSTSSGFAEQRNILNQVSERLNQERTDAQVVLREIEGLRRDAAEARVAELEAEQQPPTAPQIEDRQPPQSAADPSETQPVDNTQANYTRLLALAAGVAYAEITCHRDTWAFLVERAAQTEHFRLPAGVDEADDGTIEADLSGRTLIAVLDALWHTVHNNALGDGTRALAERIFDRIGHALQTLQPTDDGEQAVTRIVIDNRPPKEPPADSTPEPEPTTD
ncbi:hypothetical protein MTQ13_03205 [Streptomyces sp. XM4011]|uniref:hypothetical protein n=1 Tax=Streptomyces sp. XM4011 TaxID=2929780 RepID=UPI001FFB7D6B|nr:hypothetical protein [Streptomyces sp. XM4011]MCK1813289.1 hypothetical protein [Streptomyces sp. XM4011]